MAKPALPKASLSAIEIARNGRAAMRERQKRAADRLKASKGSYWHFGLARLQYEKDSCDMGDFGHLAKVDEPPNVFELMLALRNHEAALEIAAWTGAFEYELAIDRNTFADKDEAWAVANSFLLALRARSCAEFLVPAVSDRSWSTIAAFDDQTVEAHVLEHHPGARRIAPAVTVTDGHLQWSVDNLPKFMNLRNNDARFQFAADSFETQFAERDLRLMAAKLWSGIEAILDVSIEISYRLSATIASTTSPRGPDRVATYRKLKKLYGERSRVIHGATIERGKLKEHILATRALLASLLTLFTESGTVPTSAQLEESVFL